MPQRMPGRQQQARRAAVVVPLMRTMMCLSIMVVTKFAAHGTAAFTMKPETCGLRRDVKLDDDDRANTNQKVGIFHPAGAVTSSALHAVAPPPAAAEGAAQVIVDQVPAVHSPTVVSVLIPVAIAAVVYTLLFPDTSDNIRQFWEDQFETANEGPLIEDYEPVELKPKYLTTPASAAKDTDLEAERDCIVSQKGEVEEPEVKQEQEEAAPKKEVLASDQIRDFWEHEIVEKANKAPEIQSATTKRKSRAAAATEPETDETATATTATSLSTSIPVIPKEASAEELTSLVSSVAESINKNSKDFDALIAERKRAAEFDEPLSDKIKQARKSSKRRILQRAAKKAVMPWKKWDSL